ISMSDCPSIAIVTVASLLEPEFRVAWILTFSGDPSVSVPSVKLKLNHDSSDNDTDQGPFALTVNSCSEPAKGNSMTSTSTLPFGKNSSMAFLSQETKR